MYNIRVYIAFIQFFERSFLFFFLTRRILLNVNTITRSRYAIDARQSRCVRPLVANCVHAIKLSATRSRIFLYTRENEIGHAVVRHYTRRNLVAEYSSLLLSSTLHFPLFFPSKFPFEFRALSPPISSLFRIIRIASIHTANGIRVILAKEFRIWEPLLEWIRSILYPVRSIH